MASKHTFKAVETPDIYALHTLVDNPELVGDDGQHEMLRQYFLKCREKGVKVKYGYSADAKTHGRQFAIGPSLQGMRRNLRHTITKGLYTDYDIVNAHPTFLMQYCEKHDLDHDALKFYIENRDRCLADLDMPRDDAKKVPLAIINGGAGRAVAEKPDWLLSLQKEIKSIHTNMANNPKNKKLMDSIADKSNMKGSLCNHILCDIENEVLMAAVKFVGSPSNISLQFDGFMLPVGVSVDVDALAEHVMRATNWRVQFKVKPQDEAIDLTGFAPKTSLPKIIADDNEGAEYFIEKNKNILKKGKDNRIFVFHNAKWTEQHIDDILLTLLLGANMFKEANDQLYPYSGNVSGSNHLIKAVKAKLPEDPLFIDRLWFASLRKAYWADGYYDFDAGTFVRSVAPEHSMTTIRIPHNFPMRDERIVAEVKRTLLDPMFKGQEALATTYLEHCARAIAGHIEDKDWNVILGERNSGKGTLQEMHEKAWGVYCITLDGGAFFMERQRGGDAAKRNSAFIDAEYKRFIFTQEMAVDTSSNLKLDGGLIKGRLASGGDTMLGRKNYKDEINFKVQARTFILANDMPPVSPADALQTCSVFQMRAVFSDTASTDAWVQKADAQIKAKCGTPEWVAGFTWLVLDAYKPHKVVPCITVVSDTEGFQLDGGEEWTVIKKFFQITGAQTDTLTSARVQQWLRDEGLNMSPNKLKSRIELMGAKPDKNLSGGRGWRGVKLLEEQSGGFANL